MKKTLFLALLLYTIATNSFGQPACPLKGDFSISRNPCAPFDINFTTNIKAKIPIDISHNLFFIAKELINNAINHASSSIIDIELMEYQSRVELCVSDNGKQYDFNTAIKKGGLGLRSIQSRVELLNGRFEVIAKKPMGSFHQIIIPK